MRTNDVAVYAQHHVRVPHQIHGTSTSWLDRLYLRPRIESDERGSRDDDLVAPSTRDADDEATATKTRNDALRLGLFSS
jgi:hypothetical protein